jgi:hypothetical protein
VVSTDICDLVFGSSYINVHKKNCCLPVTQGCEKKVITQLLKSEVCVKCELHVKGIHECESVNTSVARLLV